MLEWLKDILKDNYTEDIDKAVSTQIGKDFVARKDYNDLNEKKKTIEATNKTLADTIKDREKDIEGLKATTGKGTELETKLNDLQEKYNKDTEALNAQIKQQKLDSALETRLIKEGAVNTKAVKALLDTTKISLEGENLLGLDDQLKGLKESEKWAFSVQAPPGKSGTRQGLPPGTGDETTLADEITSTMFGKPD